MVISLRELWSAIGFMCIVSLILLLLLCAVHGRDLDGRRVNSPLKPWFDSLRSGRGPCCADADGTTVADSDWKTEDGHYVVMLNGKWVVVPDDAVLQQPNLYGHTMVWIYGTTIRCFIPGSMT
jgi:hypothetical protein